jgi:hypothetical protein
MSRVYGGIHYRFASEDGLAGGTSIGDWSFKNYLRRVRPAQNDHDNDDEDQDDQDNREQTVRIAGSIHGISR